MASFTSVEQERREILAILLAHYRAAARAAPSPIPALVIEKMKFLGDRRRQCRVLTQMRAQARGTAFLDAANEYRNALVHQGVTGSSRTGDGRNITTTPRYGVQEWRGRPRVPRRSIAWPRSSGRPSRAGTAASRHEQALWRLAQARRRYSPASGN